MTTVICDGKNIAADSRIGNDKHTYNTEFSKIDRYRDIIYGITGNTVDMVLFKDYIEGGTKDLEFIKNNLSDNFSALSLFYDKEGKYNKLFYYNNKLVPVEIKPPYAIGSGGILALAALKAGASIKRSVEIACELDNFSGGTVNVL